MVSFFFFFFLRLHIHKHLELDPLNYSTPISVFVGNAPTEKVIQSEKDIVSSNNTFILQWIHRYSFVSKIYLQLPLLVGIYKPDF